MTDRADLRPLLPGAAAWAAAWLAWTAARPAALLVILLGAAWVAREAHRGRPRVVAAVAVLAAGAGFGSTVLHVGSVRDNPVAGLASERASVVAIAVLRADPVARAGRFGSTTSVEADVVEISARGRRFRVDAPVLVVVRSDAGLPARGARVRVAGLLARSDRPERTAVLIARTEVEVLAGPSGLTAWGNRVRRAVREAVAEQAPGPRALVPALVDGGDGAMPTEVVDDFRTAGMTHLLAVSGTNLTLIVGFLLLGARWVGVRARGLVVVGLLGVAGFLVLAGSEPSVLRAAAMGTIALIGLGHAGRERGVRALGVGVLVLVLLEPSLARSPGFALSVMATGAILVLVPRWRDALVRWLPRWAAEAVAIPLAAQLACTPLVAALSGQVSLVAVAANLAAAPLVAPATVVGLLGGLVALVSVPVAQVCAAPAGWAARLLIAIANRFAEVSLPTLGWGTSAFALLVLTTACLGLAVGLSHLLARRGATLVLVGLMVVVVLVPLPTPGWPPPGWVLALCSVGQGDAVALRVAEHAAVVVDAGPEPRPVDRCLRRLRVREVPVLVLTHFHADHVVGLAGVLRGRRIGEVLVSPLVEPAPGARQVLDRTAGIPVRSVTAGESGVLGSLSWQVLAPRPGAYPDSESPPNDASVVLLAEVRGVRILLMGDQERPSQADLRRRFPGLRADVLKVAHHGSSKQDAALVEGLGARLALISVGRDNDYGHPAASTLDLIARAGARVHRTDQEGDVAVVLTGSGALATVARGSDSRHGAAPAVHVRPP